MSDLSEIRRANVRAIIEQRGGLTKLSRTMGYKNPSFLSQMTGPEPTREITEKSARKIEAALKLVPGSLDTPLTNVPRPTLRPDLLRDTNVDLIANVIRMVGGVCDAEGAHPTTIKFAELVALAYSDSIEHNALREDHVKRLVRLVT
jgi:hypothetical protein